MRPEKLRVSHTPPETSGGKINCYRATVEDAVYQGSHTRFWVRIGAYRLSVLQSHNRYLLDQRPIRWGDEVWLSWHADDGYMLEQYSETDEDLLLLPPENIGDMDTPSDDEPEDAPEADATDDSPAQ